MAENDGPTSVEEWWDSLPEPDYAGFWDVLLSHFGSLEIWLKVMGRKGTVEDFCDRISTLREGIKSNGSLEQGYLGAYMYGQLGLVSAYLEKFDGDSPIEEIPQELEADKSQWARELREVMDEK